MLDIFSALTLAISANLDNIVIGMTYGANKIKFKLSHIITIGSIISIVTVIALLIGMGITNSISQKLSAIISAVTIISIGVISIIKLFTKNESVEEVKSLNCINLVLLAFTLSFNNFVISVAVGMSKISLFYTILFTFLFSTIFLSLGNILGRKVNSKIIGVISSILLILLGILNFVN